MQDTVLLYALLLTGVAIGWWLGNRFANQQKIKYSPDFVPSVEYLLAETNDDTLNHLLNLPKLDEEAFELFLKIGRSFRSKGDTERAIHLHQTLFARTDLQRNSLLILKHELALDYLSAGLLDRAERLLLEFVHHKGKEPIYYTAAKNLVELYEAEGEWQKICDLYEHKLLPKEDAIWHRVAHAYCELAERAEQRNDNLECRQLCRMALKIHPQCARAYVVQGDLAFHQQEPNEAVRCYLRALELNSKTIINVLPNLLASFKLLQDHVGISRHFHEQWQASHYEPALRTFIEQRVQDKGAEVAINQLLEELANAPSNQGFIILLELFLQHDLSIDKLQLTRLYDILRAIVKHESKFVCEQCGFKSNEYHWLCPSCKNWGTLTNFARR